jgi:hypothetical protein
MVQKNTGGTCFVCTCRYSHGQELINDGEQKKIVQFYETWKVPEPFPILRRASSDSMIFLFRSDVGRRPSRFLLRLFDCCWSLFDAFPHVVRTLANR